MKLKPYLGLEAVKQALESGHNVTAIVRNPSKLSITDDKLNVVEANVFDADSYKQVQEDLEMRSYICSTAKKTNFGILKLKTLL